MVNYLEFIATLLLVMLAIGKIRKQDERSERSWLGLSGKVAALETQYKVFAAAQGSTSGI
jgi:hypothetical protein